MKSFRLGETKSPRGSPHMQRKNVNAANTRNSPLSHRKPQAKHGSFGHHPKTSPLAVQNSLVSYLLKIYNSSFIFEELRGFGINF